MLKCPSTRKCTPCTRRSLQALLEFGRYPDAITLPMRNVSPTTPITFETGPCGWTFTCWSKRHVSCLPGTAPTEPRCLLEKKLDRSNTTLPSRISSFEAQVSSAKADGSYKGNAMEQLV